MKKKWPLQTRSGQVPEPIRISDPSRHRILPSAKCPQSPAFVAFNAQGPISRPTDFAEEANFQGR
jgi:hypothetical protein